MLEIETEDELEFLGGSSHTGILIDVSEAEEPAEIENNVPISAVPFPPCFTEFRLRFRSY